MSKNLSNGTHLEEPESQLLDEEWIGIGFREEAQCLAYDIANEIIQIGEDIITDRYLEEKSVPYITESVMNDMLGVIEVRFC